jgi:hypothetical protein
MESAWVVSELTAILGVDLLGRRQQIHLGVGNDQAVGEQLRQIAHDPFAGPRVLFAKALEIAQRHFEGGDLFVGQHIGGAVRFQQRHFAERHSRRERREPDAARQLDVHDPAPETGADCKIFMSCPAVRCCSRDPILRRIGTR